MKNVNHFYQTLSNGFKVLDFHKIADLNKPINIILSERYYQGKTFNALQFINERWKKYKHRAVWLYSTKDQVNIAIKRLITNNVATYPQQWKDWKSTKSGIYHKKDLVCYIASVSGSHKLKGGRDYSVSYIFYDEFNEGLTHLSTKQSANVESIVLTFSDSQKDKVPQLFLFGNQKTLAVPILSDVGINDISKELTITDSFFLLVPKKSEQQLKQLKQTKTYRISNLLGRDQSSIFNINVFDNFEGVLKTNELMSYLLEPVNTLYINKSYYQEWDNRRGIITIAKTTRESCYGDIFAVSPQDQEFNVDLNLDGRLIYRDALINGTIRFDTYNTKITILRALGYR